MMEQVFVDVTQSLKLQPIAFQRLEKKFGEKNPGVFPGACLQHMENTACAPVENYMTIDV